MGLIKQVMLRKGRQRRILLENRRLFKEIKIKKKIRIADELERLNSFKIADRVYVARQIRNVVPRRGAADVIFSDDEDEFVHDNDDDEYLSTDDENIEDEVEPSGEFFELIDRFKTFRSDEEKYEDRMLYGKLSIRAFNYKDIAMVKPHDDFEFTMTKTLKQVIWMPRLNCPAAEKRSVDFLEEEEEAAPQSHKRLRMMEDEKPPTVTKKSNDRKSSRKARTVKLRRQGREKFAQSANKKESNMAFNPSKPLGQQFEFSFGKSSAPPKPEAISIKQIFGHVHLDKKLTANLSETKAPKEIILLPDLQKQVKSPDKNITINATIVVSPVTGTNKPVTVLTTDKHVCAAQFEQFNSEVTFAKPTTEMIIPNNNGLTLYNIQKQFNEMNQVFLEYDQVEKEKFAKLEMLKELEEFKACRTKEFNIKQTTFPFRDWSLPSNDAMLIMDKHQQSIDEKEKIKEAYRNLKNEDVTDSFVCRSESLVSLVYDEDDLDKQQHVGYVDVEMVEVDRYPLNSSPGVCNFFCNHLQESPQQFANSPILLNLFQQDQPLQQYQEPLSYATIDEKMPLVETVMNIEYPFLCAQTLNEKFSREQTLSDEKKNQKRRWDFDNGADDEDEAIEFYGSLNKRIRYN